MKVGIAQDEIENIFYSSHGKEDYLVIAPVGNYPNIYINVTDVKANGGTVTVERSEVEIEE